VPELFEELHQNLLIYYYSVLLSNILNIRNMKPERCGGEGALFFAFAMLTFARL